MWRFFIQFFVYLRTRRYICYCLQDVFSSHTSYTDHVWIRFQRIYCQLVRVPLLVVFHTKIPRSFSSLVSLLNSRKKFIRYKMYSDVKISPTNQHKSSTFHPFIIDFNQFFPSSSSLSMKKTYKQLHEANSFEKKTTHVQMFLSIIILLEFLFFYHIDWMRNVAVAVAVIISEHFINASNSSVKFKSSCDRINIRAIIKWKMIEIRLSCDVIEDLKRFNSNKFTLL